MKQFDRAVLPLHAIACVTSIGVRITPPDRMAVHNSDLFRLQATSAETNVLNVASSLGMGCLAMTKFVKGSPVAEFIKQQLRARNIRFEGRAGRSVGISSSVQYCRFRLWAAGTTCLE